MSRPGSSKAAISTTAAAASALSADSEDSEFLQCFICYEDLKKATLCPSCSKLACEDCLYKWLAQESKCPHCRSKLEVGQLVRARFIDELQQTITTNQEKLAKETCPAHAGTPLTYYCGQCRTPICADCGMLGDHKGHGFESLQAAYNRHKEELTERKLPAAHESLQRYNDAAVELGKNIQKCKEAKAKVENELNLTFEGIRMKLDSKFQAKKMLLNNHLTPLTDAKKSLRDRIAKLEASLKRDPPAVMMRRLGEMTRSLEKAQKFKPQAYVVDPTIEAWFMPKYTEARVTVPGFRERCLEKETFKSAIMTVYGVSWRLKVYCGGNEQAKDKYVSVFVELVSSVFPNSREEYQYRIELKHPSGAPDAPKSIVRDYAKTFAVNETWGWYNFVSLEKLREDGFLDAENELSFVYGVRPVDAEQQAALKERYIKYLEQKVDRLEYPELNSIPLSKRAKEKSTSTDSKVTIEIDDDDDDVVLNEDVSNNIKLEYPSDRKGICSRSIDEVDDDSGGVGPSKRRRIDSLISHLTLSPTREDSIPSSTTHTSKLDTPDQDLPFHYPIVHSPEALLLSGSHEGAAAPTPLRWPVTFKDEVEAGAAVTAGHETGQAILAIMNEGMEFVPQGPVPNMLDGMPQPQLGLELWPFVVEGAGKDVAGGVGVGVGEGVGFLEWVDENAAAGGRGQWA